MAASEVLDGKDIKEEEGGTMNIRNNSDTFSFSIRGSIDQKRATSVDMNMEESHTRNM